MKVLLLLLILPCLVLGEVCPGGTLTCPEGKSCCEVNGEQSCCGRGKRSVLDVEEYMLQSGRPFNTSIYKSQAGYCEGTMCPDGCCRGRYYAVCCPDYCCEQGTSCCTKQGCCAAGLYCTGGTCCREGFRGCGGAWCCKNNWKCGFKPFTCGSESVVPTVAVLLGVAVAYFGRKSLLS